MDKTQTTDKRINTETSLEIANKIVEWINLCDSHRAKQEIILSVLADARNSALDEAARLMDEETCYTELGNKIRSKMVEI